MSIKEFIINIRMKMGWIDYYDYWDFRLAQMKKKGLVVGENVHILDSNIDSGFLPLITIGDNVTITGATILAHDASTKKFIGFSKCGKVTIGNNVFIGYGVIILPGVTIGDNVIIGAGTVVRRDILDDSMAIGNPMIIVGKVSEHMNKNLEALRREGIVDKDIGKEYNLKMNKKMFVD